MAPNLYTLKLSNFLKATFLISCPKRSHTRASCGGGALAHSAYTYCPSPLGLGRTHCTNIAHDLVHAARGTIGKKGWRTKKDQIASGDNTTVFVVPLNCHRTVLESGCLGGETYDNPLESNPITYASESVEESVSKQ